MKILSVSGHGCIRATKMNLALIAKGHDVHFITKRMVPYSINYKSHSIGGDYDQTREAMKLYAPFVDLCHAHNEPSWYVTMWKEISDKPIILDVHDSCLARVTPEQWTKNVESGKAYNVRVSTEERNNFQLADGLVFPGKGFGDLVCGEFNLKQPRLDLPSYVNKHFYSYFPLEWQGGLVYEGKVALEKELPMFSYCDYRQASKEANEMGMDFHIYPAGYVDKLQPLYKAKENSTTYIHTPVLLEELIKKIGKHDWGLVGNVYPTPEWDVAVPNKMFEYAAAGLPIVVMNAKEAGALVKKYGLGIEVKSLKELGERWGEHRQIRASIAKVRHSLTMDNQICNLEAFYREVQNGCR